MTFQAVVLALPSIFHFQEEVFHYLKLIVSEFCGYQNDFKKSNAPVKSV